MSVFGLKENTQFGDIFNRFRFIEDFVVGLTQPQLGLFLGLFLFGLSSIAQVTSGEVTFDEIPLDKQLVARDGNDKGQVLFSGNVDDSPEYDEIIITVRKSGMPSYSNSYTEALVYNNGVAPFSIITEIEAELSNFYFEIELINGGSTKTVDLPLGYGNDVVAGDVFIVHGQSNAEAKQYSGSASSEENEFIRSYANSTEIIADLIANDKWYEANADEDWRTGDGNIGQWGARLANMLRQDLDVNVPIAIFNGSRGGKPIQYFLENNTGSSEPTPSTNNYYRLKYRLEQTGLQNAVKAILWSQGENTSSSLNNYYTQFESLVDSWIGNGSGDFPNVEQIYIFQTINGCNYPNNMPKIMYSKEAQRLLAQNYDYITVVNVDGLTQNPGDDCHFTYTDGYKEFAERIFPFVYHDFYDPANGVVAEINKSPDIIKAYLQDATTLVVETDQDLWVNDASQAFQNFALENANGATIIGLTLFGKNLEFTLSQYPGGSASISNLGALPGVSSNLVKNTSLSGPELLSFYQFPVDDVSNSATMWVSGDWSNGGPTSSKDAIIVDDFSLSDYNRSFSTNDLTINPGVNFDYDNGTTRTLKVTGDLIIEGDMIIGDTESLIIDDPNANVQVSGSFTKIENTSELKSSYDVTYWSSPVSGLTLDDAFFDNGVASNRVFYYDPGSENPSYTGTYYKYRHWFIGSGSQNVVVGKGYSVDGPGASGYPKTGEFSFSGIPNFQNIDVPINTWSPYFDDSDLTNLLGNPYPCAIDANELIDENDTKFDGTIYLWTHASDYLSGEYQDDYITYTKTGPNNSEIPDPYYIASGQGFMILANSGSSTFRFTNDMQHAGENDAFFKRSISQKKTISTKQKDRIWFNITKDENFKKQILIGFDSLATDGVDIGYDGKLINPDVPLRFYSKLDNEKFAVQGLGTLNEVKIVGIGFDTDSSGNYSIGISKTQGQLNQETVFIRDRKLRKLHNLKESDYHFEESLIGEVNERFVLILGTNQISPEDEQTPDIDTDLTVISVTNKKLFASAQQKIIKLDIYDFLGRNLIKRKPNQKEIIIHLDRLKEGSVFIVNMTLEGGSFISKKIAIN